MSADAPQKPSPVEAQKNRAKQNLKAVIEHTRGTITIQIFAKDQFQFLDPLDKISSMIIQESREAETMQKAILTMKDTARRVLRPVPAKMTRVLNELDGLSKEVEEFSKILARAPRSRS